MSEIDKQTFLSEWRESATYWKKHSATIHTMFTPVTEALIEEAAIGKGQTVLDVAGGAGEPSVTIAEIVGPEGSVTYTDAVAEMVAAAEVESHRRGVTNMVFRQCLADSLPFEQNSFDVAVSRLGVMLFSDPVAAIRDMLRVTKREGALSFVVWGTLELNPFIHVVTEVLSRHVESPPVDPDAPGAFRFAETGKLARVLTDAGASAVRERPLAFRIEAPISRAEFWEMRSGMSGTLREKLASLPSEQARQIGLEVQEAVRQFFPKEVMSFPAQMIIVTGTKP